MHKQLRNYLRPFPFLFSELKYFLCTQVENSEDKVIPMLTDPEKFGGKAEDSFDVVIPSLPGFGFSDRKAMTDTTIAQLWAKLMTKLLDYKRFTAAGGDLGSGVTKALALKCLTSQEYQ